MPYTPNTADQDAYNQQNKINIPANPYGASTSGFQTNGSSVGSQASAPPLNSMFSYNTTQSSNPNLGRTETAPFMGDRASGEVYSNTGRTAEWYKKNLGISDAEYQIMAAQGKLPAMAAGHGMTGSQVDLSRIYGDPNQVLPENWHVGTQQDADGNLYFGKADDYGSAAYGANRHMWGDAIAKAVAMFAGAGVASGAIGGAGQAGTAGGGLEGATSLGGGAGNVVDLGGGVLTNSGVIGSVPSGLNAVVGGAISSTGGGIPNNTVDPEVPQVNINGVRPPAPITAPPPIIPDLSGLINNPLTPEQTNQIQTPPSFNTASPSTTSLPRVPPIPSSGSNGGAAVPPSGTGGNNSLVPGVNNGTLQSILGTLLGGGTAGGSGGAGGLGNLANLLYGAYSKNQIGSSMKGVFDQLNGMYKPGTPEYDDMRHRIEARDAAAGRRSQYGPRERELAASMADSRMRTLTSPGFFNIQSAMLNNQPSSGGLSELFGSLANGGQNDIGGLLARLFSSSGSGTNYNPLVSDNTNSDSPIDVMF